MESTNCKNDCTVSFSDEKKSDNDDILQLNAKLDRIEKLLNNDILQNCNRMSNHIDFIERIYDYIKVPLFYITNKVQSITSWNKVHIPIEYSGHETESTYEG
jgi:hypothetical protein|uniref:Uncharacterized protein n=1 Tax=viral metagenome TaxID=1070528 RepID=A0A6C0BQY2_9ZZZZ